MLFIFNLLIFNFHIIRFILIFIQRNYYKISLVPKHTKYIYWFLLFLGYKMASRFNQEYFFQHSLMNIPFTYPNEIIHPNAENIPEYIRHYAKHIGKIATP